MSLSGLDDVKVKEAHEAAVAEPGGWFLLKYASRDEVDLLGRGNGGIVEVRNAITKYDDESPLFGFLRYRRRNVLIKYVPESCSRLVQARVTVHFNAVTERFSPHDTTFPITSPKELRDTTLSAACSLHTASGSTSSSTSSLRRRRLMEIAEDAEEDKRQSTVLEERPTTAKDPSASSPQVPLPSALQSIDFDTTNHRSVVTASEATTVLSYKPPKTSDGSPGSPTKPFDGRRKSSQFTRPENYSYNSYSSIRKPKVKLGPRPSLDTSGRPHTSASSVNYRPVSTLPAGLRLFSKSSRKQKDHKEQEVEQDQNGRPKSQYPAMPPSMTLSPPPMDASAPLQQTIILRPHTSGGRPATSSGTSVRPPLSPITATSKLPVLTPEKARLLKALEMRKKQKNATTSAELTSPATDAHSASPITETPLLDPMSQVTDDMASPSNHMVKSDSAIAIEVLSAENSAESDATRTNSNPASPMGPSEESHSTRASSVSDSTDETVQENHHLQSNILVKCVDPVETRDIDPVQESEPVEPVMVKDDQVQVSAIDESDGERDEVGIVSPYAVEGGPATSSPLPGTAEYVDHPPKGNFENTSSVVNGESAITQKDEPQYHNGNQTVGVESVLALENATCDQQMQAKIIQETLGASPTAMLVGAKQAEITKESTEAFPTPKSPILEWKIPRSKFSVQDLKSKAIEAPGQKNAAALTIPPKSTIGSTTSEDTRSWITDFEREIRRPSLKQKKRKDLVEPIRTDISVSGHNSEAELLSDDDLMDELQSATVQEAKPISVSKSPINPVFPNQVKAAGEGNRFSRAFSNPLRKDSPKNQLLSPHDSSRSVSASAAYLNRLSQQPTVPIVKKVNLGSGISQRIKALEKLSGNQSTPPGGIGPAPGLPTSLFPVRKPGSRGSKSPSIMERAESLSRNTPSPSISRESSPEALKLHNRSGSTHNQRDAFNSPATSKPQRSRPESISVTARIIRDPNQPFPSKPEMPRDALDYTPLDLKQSPLLIDHQKAIVIPQPTQKETIPEKRLAKESKGTKRERRSSITVVKDLIKERRSSFAERRKSMTIDTPTRSPAPSPSRAPSTYSIRPMSVSSRRSNSSRDLALSLTPASPPTNSSPTNSEDTVEKKAGRATRMLRRMSSSISAGRKTIAHAISPTVREESESPQARHQSLSLSQPSQSFSAPAVTVNVGDVNVQFPDTLLWKRRTMIVDSQGFLLLSQAQGSKVMEKSAGLKRYHLNEFRSPFIPEMEVQELPNSVVLDFTEGGGLQVACEDRGGQMRVLQVLQEAHRSWTSSDQ